MERSWTWPIHYRDAAPTVADMRLTSKVLDGLAKEAQATLVLFELN